MCGTDCRGTGARKVKFCFLAPILFCNIENADNIDTDQFLLEPSYVCYMNVRKELSNLILI